jgi:multidrug efflux pump subunit AcrA (membrane-fusion protein)
VRDGDLFSARPVMTGQDDGQHVEIVHGLQTGEYYVTHGGFILKDEAEKNQ